MSVKIEMGGRLPESKVGKVNWYKDMQTHNKKIDESRVNSRKDVARQMAKDMLKVSRKGGDVIASSCCFSGEEYERIFGHK